MKPGPSSRQPLVLAIAATAGLLLAASLPALAPAPAFSWSAFALVAALAAVAAVHRPLGGSGLGIGAAAAALAFLVWGGVVGAWVAVAAGGLGELGFRWMLALVPQAPRERRGWWRAALAGLRSGVATLAGAAVWTAIAPSRPLSVDDGAVLLAGLSSAAVYVVVAVLLDRAFVAARPFWRAPWPRLSLPALLEAVAWCAGIGLAVVADRASFALAVLGLASLSALAAEAARHARLHVLSERRAGDLARVTRASERMEPGGRPFAAIAEQLRIECRSILPCQWFQVELEAVGGGPGASWWAGPDGVLREGTPEPGPAPPPIPGFHRRGAWDVTTRELRVEGQRIGTLRLWCDGRAVAPASRQLLDELLPQMAASVHRALLDREAKEDPLTGVLVRRVLEGRLQSAYRRAHDEGGSVAVIMCDIDHFKRINDTFGHGAGDRALVAVAKALDTGRREHDLLCRYGGEEFTMLLEGADGAEALEVAERLRRAVERLDVREGEARIALSLSAGVAAFPELHVKAATELLLLADSALYQAKRAGRNRCFLDLGGGELRDGSGAAVHSDGAIRSTATPQIFA